MPGTIHVPIGIVLIPVIGMMGLAIDGYRQRGLIGDALRLALDYPHLDASRVLFAEHPAEARNYLGALIDEQPGHANGRYALGLALIAIGESEEAIEHLEMARNVRGING